MQNQYTPEITVPFTLNDYVDARIRYPDATLVAGGTLANVNNDDTHMFLPRHVIVINQIAELKKISGDERFLEIGSAVTINEILDLGKKIIPAILFSVCSNLGSEKTRNMATIGGNVAYNPFVLDITPALFLLNGEVEILTVHTATRKKSTRWTLISHLMNDSGLLDIKINEIFVRFRIPMETYSLQFYEKNNPLLNSIKDVFIFYAVAELAKEVITNIKFLYSDGKNFLFHSMELNSLFIGYSYPFLTKELENAGNLLDTFFSNKEVLASRFFIYQAKMLTLKFLSQQIIISKTEQKLIIRHHSK